MLARGREVNGITHIHSHSHMHTLSQAFAETSPSDPPERQQTVDLIVTYYYCYEKMERQRERDGEMSEVE